MIGPADEFAPHDQNGTPMPDTDVTESDRSSLDMDEISREDDSSPEARSGLPGWLLPAVLALVVLGLIIVGYFVVRELTGEKTPETASGAQIVKLKAQMEEDPENLMLYFQLAEVYYSVGEFDEAITAIEEVRSRETTGFMAAEAVYGLARIAEAQGELEQSEEYFMESFEIHELGEARYALGRMYVGQDRIDDAIEQWERYLELDDSGDAGAIRDLAKLYEEQGDNARALELYTQAAVYMPDDEEVAEALRRLGAK